MHPFRLPVKSVVKKYSVSFTKLNCLIPIGTTNVICELSALERSFNLRNSVHLCATTFSSVVPYSSFVFSNKNENHLCCNNIDNICSVRRKENYKYCQTSIYKNLKKSTTNSLTKENLLVTEGLLLDHNDILVTNVICNKVGTILFYFTFLTWSFL